MALRLSYIKAEHIIERVMYTGRDYRAVSLAMMRCQPVTPRLMLVKDDNKRSHNV